MTTTDRPKTINAARGRWREILVALGIPEKALNGRNQACPVCGGEDRFRFTDFRGDGDYFCTHCKPGKGLTLVQSFRGWDWQTTAHEVDQVINNLPTEKPEPRPQMKPSSPQLLNSVWSAGHVITPACVTAHYLTSRGIDLDLSAFNGALRGVDHCYHSPSRTRPPALLARLFDVAGKPRQLHRTYLTQHGRKSELKPCRMFMPGSLPDGGAIRLGRVQERMGVAEGIETALSAKQLFGLPVWATTCEAMLRHWEPPEGVTSVMIFGDNDENGVGQSAAFELMRRLAQRKLDVEVIIPPEKGTDWNDVLMAKEQAHAAE